MGYKSGYGKRPWWYWALIYVVVGGLLYFLIYKFYLKDKSYYDAGKNSGSESDGALPSQGDNFGY